MILQITPTTKYIVASLIFATIALLGFSALRPNFYEGTYSIVQGDRADDVRTFDYPLQHWANDQVVQGSISMAFGWFHPHIFRVYPDDCLEQFSVNGGTSTHGSAYCDYTYGHDLDWSSNVHTGVNRVDFRIRNFNGPGGFYLGVSPWDPWAFFFELCAIAAIVLLVVASYTWPRISGSKRIFLSIFWSGALLRLIYVIRTPLGLRSYDYNGHVDYILYVLQHFSIPEAQDGWQYYQPPLYYLLNAVLLLPLKLLGASDYILIRSGQCISFALSCIALWIGMRIAHLLFHEHRQRIYAYLFSAFVAIFPGIIFLSSRISNDALVVPLSFAFLLCLYRWYQGRERMYIVHAAVFLALGILTKSNFFALLPVLIIAIALNEGTQMKRKLSLIFVSLGIMVIASSGYFFIRLGVENEQHIVGNIERNSEGLRVGIGPENFFYFRPHEVIRVPYAQAWSDDAGRNRFWEHLFKTAHTGEWDFGYRVHAIMRVMLALSMILLSVGMWRGLYLLWFFPKAHVIQWVTVLSLIGSMMVLVSVENVGGFQDFRYVPALVIPATWYVLDGVRILPSLLRRMAIGLFSLFIILSFFFYYTLLFPID